MSTQSNFLTFHETIKLKRYKQNAALRQKRDAVLTRLRAGLQEHTFTAFNRGSYEMGTGVRPLQGDYDIDVGVILNHVNRHSHAAKAVKRAVYSAVQKHTAQVTWKRPCITVQYQERGAPLYHVDIAVYASASRWNPEQLVLAVGKEHGDVSWERADPKGLLERIENRHYGEQAAQFRRVLRYLKRWRDVHFPAQGNAAPIGIGLTVAAYEWFVPVGRGTPATHDDHEALRRLVFQMLRGFRLVWTQHGYAERLALPLPVIPNNDVFEKMTNQQMREFKQRLSRLSDWLARGRPDFRAAFGHDFPA